MHSQGCTVCALALLTHWGSGVVWGKTARKEPQLMYILHSFPIFISAAHFSNFPCLSDLPWAWLSVGKNKTVFGGASVGSVKKGLDHAGNGKVGESFLLCLTQFTGSNLPVPASERGAVTTAATLHHCHCDLLGLNSKTSPGGPRLPARLTFAPSHHSTAVLTAAVLSFRNPRSQDIRNCQPQRL